MFANVWHMPCTLLLLRQLRLLLVGISCSQRAGDCHTLDDRVSKTMGLSATCMEDQQRACARTHARLAARRPRQPVIRTAGFKRSGRASGHRARYACLRGLMAFASWWKAIGGATPFRRGAGLPMACSRKGLGCSQRMPSNWNRGRLPPRWRNRVVHPLVGGAPVHRAGSPRPRGRRRAYPGPTVW